MSEPAQRLDDAVLDRRTQILNAAERSFARAGFHRTTMQDVAAETGMSPGNLYRYFPSKDALVAGLCERDRGELVEEFAAVRDAGANFMEVFKDLGRRHFEDAAAGKAKLCLEIWAEAARNPAIAAMQTDFDRSLQEQFVAVFEAAKKAGAVDPALNSSAAASIIAKLGDGLFVRRAAATDFEPEREVAEVFDVICALMSGVVKFSSSSSGSEVSS